jgi:hypothetical protein
MSASELSIRVGEPIAVQISGCYFGQSSGAVLSTKLSASRRSSRDRALAEGRVQGWPPGGKPMASFLVHVTTGPEDPTKAALALLVALTAAKEGHAVNLFLEAMPCRL